VTQSQPTPYEHHMIPSGPVGHPLLVSLITSSSSSETALRRLQGQDSEICSALRWEQRSGCAPCVPLLGGRQRVLSIRRAHQQEHPPQRSWRAAGHWRREWSCWHHARREGRAWLLGARGWFRRQWCRPRWRAWRRRFGGCLSSWDEC
jgi:hypothetical protein